MKTMLEGGSSHQQIPEGKCHCWACRGRAKRSLHSCSPSYGVTTELLPGEQRTILPWEQGNRSPGVSLRVGRQKKRGTFPTALAASLHQLPRKHMKLLSHVPGAPALSRSDRQEMTATDIAARDK